MRFLDARFLWRRPPAIVEAAAGAAGAAAAAGFILVAAGAAVEDPNKLPIPLATEPNMLSLAGAAEAVGTVGAAEELEADAGAAAILGPEFLDKALGRIAVAAADPIELAADPNELAMVDIL